jgi:plasmid stabilization system protein ParE
MDYEIIWSNDAGLDLIEIISYIKENSGKKIADEIYNRIRSKVVKIKSFPKLGAVSKELK